ncbi:hypothetical protein [Nocardioides ferulae]|uniref:hypothetical protein n=1 Tax=Nocardioides ferulae TaxID=2340821 RepID=UPI000EB12DD4|nr:hypothetical protein [Nocardioides ferulae]
MPEQQDSRRTIVFALVIGLIVVGLGAMLLIGLLAGDDTDDTTEQPDSRRLGGPAAVVHAA